MSAEQPDITVAIPETLQPIVNLAKVRELVLLDAQHCMPPAPETKAQREKLIRGIEHTIGEALYGLHDRLPEQPPKGLDPVSSRAFTYVAQTAPLAPQTPSPSAYENLRRLFDRLGDLNQANMLVDWMESTRLVPGVSDGNLDDAAVVTKQYALRMLDHDDVRKWLKDARSEKLGEWETRNLDLMQYTYSTAFGLGEERIKTFERARSASVAAWNRERAKLRETPPGKVDFEGWRPQFEAMIAAQRDNAKALAEVFGLKDPYEALMQVSNPGLKRATVDRVLGDLAEKLPPLAAAIIEKQKHEPAPLTLPDVAEEDQMRVVRSLMHKFGLDETHARADQSAHPGSADLQWDDQRLTVRKGPRDLLSRIQGLIHETGHELYSKNLPRKWKDQPVGNFQSMWVHESQSMFWEREVAFTPGFMEFLSGHIKGELAKINAESGTNKYDINDPAWSSANLYRHVMQVLPENPLRTEADDVTTPLHIVLRHQLGSKLIDGTMKPADLPREWNKAYKDLLNVTVTDDAVGCTQDKQMALGNFAGFPGYTFGRLGAAMLGKNIREEMSKGSGPDFDTCVRAGNFAPIARKLSEKIHSQGSRYEGVELMERATGIVPFSAQPYLDEICARYGVELPQLGKGWVGRTGTRPCAEAPAPIKPAAERGESQPRGAGK